MHSESGLRRMNRWDLGSMGLGVAAGVARVRGRAASAGPVGRLKASFNRRQRNSSRRQPCQNADRPVGEHGTLAAVALSADGCLGLRLLGVRWRSAPPPRSMEQIERRLARRAVPPPQHLRAAVIAAGAAAGIAVLCRAMAGGFGLTSRIEQRQQDQMEISRLAGGLKIGTTFEQCEASPTPGRRSWLWRSTGPWELRDRAGAGPRREHLRRERSMRAPHPCSGVAMSNRPGPAGPAERAPTPPRGASPAASSRYTQPRFNSADTILVAVIGDDKMMGRFSRLRGLWLI
jgi:hypothetical protein